VSKWYVDRSRYEAGFACPYSRLLHYHALGTGLVPSTEPSELSTGHEIHSALELVLNRAIETKVPATAVDLDGANLGRGFSTTESEGLVHAWVRSNLPWLMDNYDILSAEEEFSIDVGDDIVWMARPDCVVRSKATGLPCVVEFKSTRAKADRMGQLYANSLQSIMNAYAVSSKYNQPCGEVQIHVLQLGTEQYPTPITHAYYRAGQPPYVPEDWQPTSRRPDGTWLGKLYRRVSVAAHRSIPEWVWSMPASALAAVVPIIKSDVDPTIQGLKVMQAINSIRINEAWWRDTLSKIDWTSTTPSDLSNLVPRSFNCHSYNRLCEYTPLCFDPDTYTLNPARADAFWDAGRSEEIFKRRQPHHPQEEQ